MAVVVSLCIIRKSYISGCILINAHYCCGGGGVFFWTFVAICRDNKFW